MSFVGTGSFLQQRFEVFFIGLLQTGQWKSGLGGFAPMTYPVTMWYYVSNLRSMDWVISVSCGISSGSN